jgi:hypothetical protein
MVRLKFALKYAHTYDPTWDNVDVMKWSVLEILSACICGNLMPLRPLVDRLVPTVRSVFSSYARGSRKSSDKGSNGLGNLSWPSHRKRSPKKPELISTMHFTQMSLGPYKEGTREDGNKMDFPFAMPSPAYFGNKSGTDERHVDEGSRPIPHGMIRKTPTIESNTSGREGRTSEGGSEREFLALHSPRDQHSSGSWSRALSMVFERA